ncbi:MAG: putative Ig domain-containing protein, partial [Acidimicrobiales bacterium]
NVSLYPGEVDTNPVYNAFDSDVVTGTTTGGPLGVAIASYDGDSVTTTPSESALAGTDVTYEVTVSNTTASTQMDVAVPVDLPANFTLHSGSETPSAGATVLAAGFLTWTVPSIAAGASDTLSYTETTDTPGALESDATTASAASDQSTTPSTASVSASVEVIPAADLSISVSDGVDSIAPGASDTYTITLTNNGPSPVTNATVADTLNGGFTALFAVSSIGGTAFVDLGADQFEWTGINLASGATATFDLMGTVSSSLSAGSAFVNLASGSLPPGQIDTDASSNAVDSDSVILALQAISFTPPTLGVAGQSATLSATGGGSGNPVVFSVDPSSGAGVCTVSGTDGTTLDYQEPGTCIIDANQAGNASYAAAPTVTATIAVEQIPTFTVDSPPTTGTVGQGYAYAFTASGVPTPTYSLAPGAPSWLSVDATTGALSGTPPTGTTSFTYSVIATNGVGNATAGPFTVSVSTTTNSRLADISAALSCPATVQVRAEASCTLTVDNAGPATAGFVTAGITLPFRFWRVSATGSGPWFGNAGVWFVRSLAPGSSASFTVTFRAWIPGRGLVVGAGLSESPDPDHANNVAVANVDVTGSTTPTARRWRGSW